MVFVGYKKFLIYIKSLIKIGEIEKALELLEKKLKESSFSSEFTLLQSRLSSLYKKIRQGTISDENANLESNKIVNSLLEILKKVEQDKPSIKKLKKAFFLRNLGELIPLVSIIIVLGFFVGFFYLLSILYSTFNYNYQKSMPSTIIDHKIETSTFERVRFIGKDNNNNSAEYYIYITKDFNWEKGKDATSERFGEKKDVCVHLGKHEVIKRINNDEIIGLFALGNSSFEENSNISDASQRLKEEEDRASFRAKKLASCVGDQLTHLTPLFTINLGKHIKADNNSNYQRLIVVIGLAKTIGPTIHEEALFNGLVKEYLVGNLEFDIRNYSKVVNHELDIKKVLN